MCNKFCRTKRPALVIGRIYTLLSDVGDVYVLSYPTHCFNWAQRRSNRLLLNKEIRRRNG